MNNHHKAGYLFGFVVLLSACSNNNDLYQGAAYPQYYTQSGGYNNSPQLISSAQLESLLSPIALYPDSLLSLMLLASTYPLEVAEAYNWRNSNSSLNGAALKDALKAQSWNDSVKSLLSFPPAFNMMGGKLQWTQNLGNAYKLQPADTMKAVQVLRKRAIQAGTLKSNQQMTVSTDANSNILIGPANTQMVYVPNYNPTVVYGPWPYPDYPPYPAYNPAWGIMSFGLGMAVGEAFWSTPSWSNGTINVNNNDANNPGRSSRGLIGPSSIQNQQRLLNDWKNNATPQDRQAARAAGQRADNAFQKDATPQERTQANRLNQEARNDYQQDRSNPNTYREAAQENAMRDQARYDRMNDDRFGGRGGFGGGRMGGFRR
ncbi:DUF3300 domain-containing protein [Polynucleobacter arcticus]|uniref:DUF3300 domain-containing protein n=1 Tax=Polynucleobacter arcticus TaxID=1743165 RepID=A0A6M9PLU5_9BURK|nr:DUF3300 domain-containing protein [Polynucleobacter arcticus]QKM60902.1 hypothetical protein DN92_07620 [Polynucleobacter arcticus]